MGNFTETPLQPSKINKDFPENPFLPPNFEQLQPFPIPYSQLTIPPLDRILSIYEKDAVAIDHTDDISLDIGQWLFNLRLSNTDPVIRLNVESLGKNDLMHRMTTELLDLIRK